MKLALMFFLILATSCGYSQTRKIEVDNIIDVYNTAKNQKDDALSIDILHNGIKKYHPNPPQDYEDSLHVRYYRLMKYELAYRLAVAGKRESSKEIFDWLISTDRDIK